MDENFLRGGKKNCRWRSRSPASAGLIPARTLSGLRAAAEQSHTELRSFCWVLRWGDKKGYLFEIARFYLLFMCFLLYFHHPSWG